MLPSPRQRENCTLLENAYKLWCSNSAPKKASSVNATFATLLLNIIVICNIHSNMQYPVISYLNNGSMCITLETLSSPDRKCSLPRYEITTIYWLLLAYENLTLALLSYGQLVVLEYFSATILDQQCFNLNILFIFMAICQL